MFSPRLLILVAAAAVLAAVMIAGHQPETVPVAEHPQSTGIWGDAKAGQSKAAVCGACHGIDGNPLVPLYPRIAGQNERYIARQLAMIASGERNAGLVVAMAPLVQGLSAQDMRDIGAYFAAQQATPADGPALPAVAPPDPQARRLYLAGDADRGIPACSACHGPHGAGNPGPGYPRLAGQHADYLLQRLQYFQSGQPDKGERDGFAMMAQISRELTAQELQSLASYLQDMRRSAPSRSNDG